jgi:hypothetical protein
MVDKVRITSILPICIFDSDTLYNDTLLSGTYQPMHMKQMRCAAGEAVVFLNHLHHSFRVTFPIYGVPSSYLSSTYFHRDPF